MMGFYRQSFDSIQDVNLATLHGDFLDTPNYTSRLLITRGPWVKIGNSQELLASAKIPELRIVNILYYKDERRRRVALEELDKYLELSAYGGQFFENRLQRLLEAAD